MPILIVSFTKSSDPATHTTLTWFATDLARLAAEMFIVIYDVVVFVCAVFNVKSECAVLFLDLSR